MKMHTTINPHPFPLLSPAAQANCSIQQQNARIRFSGLFPLMMMQEENLQQLEMRVSWGILFF
jgi:hypothetical protein